MKDQRKFLRTLALGPVRDVDTTQAEACKRKGLVTHEFGHWFLTDAGRELLMDY